MDLQDLSGKGGFDDHRIGENKNPGSGRGSCGGDRLSSASTREPDGERHARLGSRLSGLGFREFLDDRRTGGSPPSNGGFDSHGRASKR